MQATKRPLIMKSKYWEDYLAETEEINFSHHAITAMVNEWQANIPNELAFIQTAYEFVRDHIAHSWDIQGQRVTYRASDVLQYKEGICYAKANLLCAFLRNRGIPSGFCYQRLTLGDTPDTGYVIHALNGVYLRDSNQWIRLDARGNKPGVNAQFSIEAEMLAFPIRPHYNEMDYPFIYAHPNPKTMDALKQSTNALDTYKHLLPTSL